MAPEVNRRDFLAQLGITVGTAGGWRERDRRRGRRDPGAATGCSGRPCPDREGHRSGHAISRSAT